MNGNENVLVDLTRTMAPDVPLLRDYLRQGLAQVAENPDLSNIVQSHRFHGTSRDLEAGGGWLAKRLGSPVPTNRLLLTSGTQNILMILLGRLVPKGAVIATEELTYAALGQLARLAGVSIVPVKIDAFGMRSDDLERVLKENKVAFVYINPTGHNPTTSIMPVDRRIEIASIARKYMAYLLEDDVHGFITENAPRPIASIAPDITWYIMTVSKCLGIGLKAAYLMAPSLSALDEINAPLPSVYSWFVSGLSAELITNLIESGVAETVARQISVEIGNRQSVAQEVLGQLGIMHTNPSSLHVWLDLPQSWPVDELVSAAQSAGVTLRNPRVFAGPGIEVNHNDRLSMIAPPNPQILSEGLTKVREILLTRM